MRRSPPAEPRGSRNRARPPRGRGTTKATTSSLLAFLARVTLALALVLLRVLLRLREDAHLRCLGRHAGHAGHAGKTHAWHAGKAHAWHAGEPAALHGFLRLARHGDVPEPGDISHHPEVLPEAAHHLAHEQELLDELAHAFGRLPRALRDALHARRLANEHLRIAALAERHRLNHRFDAHELAVVELLRRAGRHHAREPRDLVHEVRERAHLLQHADLIQEVVERELAAHHASGVLLGLLLVDDGLEVLHQADHVAHAEHAARHALGAERLELVGGFAHAGENDRRARDFLHAERGAAARVAVELGENDAADAEALVEALGRFDGVLADHRVDDEQHVLRADRVLDR